MGLDIHLESDKHDDQLYNGDIDPILEQHKQHSLSRTFCNLMCRKNVIDSEPELDQIGRIANVDILPLYAMENYGNDADIESQLDFLETDAEKNNFLESVADARRKIENNIDQIQDIINHLITSLTNINNLPALLNNHGGDFLNQEDYFANFKTDTGDGYIGNHFGQDLRNFKQFIIHAKNSGASTVYFVYG